MKLLQQVSAVSLLLLATLHLQGCGSGIVQAAAVQGTALTIALSPQADSAVVQQTTADLQISANTGSPLKLAFQATGGQSPYTWSVASGVLPDGLGLTPEGTLTGVARTAGSWDAVVSVHDSAEVSSPATKHIRFSFQQGGTSAALTISSTIPGNAQIGDSYSGLLSASGGTKPYAWSLTSGALPAGLHLDAATGAVTGTPTTSGTATFTASISDAGSPPQKQSKQFSINVAAPVSPLTINTSQLNSGQSGTPYTASLQVSGGNPAYTWSVTSGSLPAGLTLSAAGVLSGTPQSAANYAFAVTVADHGSPVQHQLKAFSLSITKPVLPLVVSTADLAAAQVGTPYSMSLQASGGTPAYQWSLASGSLPKGLSLSAGGLVTGTPTQVGTSTFTVNVADTSAPAQHQSKTLTLAVKPTPLVLNTAPLAQGKVGVAYNATLQASGGTPNYVWSVASGNLPAGLSLASNGVLSGTPKTAGASSFVLAVADASSPAQHQKMPFTLTIAPSLLVWNAGSLDNGKVGVAYNATLQASGGTPNYIWAVANGNLPDGLSLATNGVLSGTPKTAGTSSFILAVADSGTPAQWKTAPMSLTIAASIAPLTISTGSLPSTTSSASYSVNLQANGGTPQYTWSLASGQLPLGLSLSGDGVLSGAAKLPGTYPFTVAVTDAGNPAQHQSRAFSLTVSNSPLAFGTPNITPGRMGTYYSAGFYAAGGTPRYTWAITSGALPDGVTMDELTGVMYGTPTKSGTFPITVAVSDHSVPAQTQSRSFSFVIAGATAPLAISTNGLGQGSTGKSYSGSLSASGGTPAYTWSIASGSLPAGLSLSSSTGVISGTPTTAGISTFTVSISDSASSQAVTASASIDIEAAGMTTWYVRPDGGTRFSTRVQNGQCDGQADVPYPGKGVNQHCAFQDFRYLWDDKSGSVGIGSWVIAGGDTVIIRGCTAGPNQSNASNPNCRLGWDAPTGTGDNLWCYGVGSYSCTNPPIPAGTADKHTRILGQNYATCAANGSTNPREYVRNLTQIFAGFSLQYAFNLRDTQYVDVQCIELTTHNGVCVTSGSPQYPRPCNREQPLDDYALNGFTLDNKSSNILFQDVYVHGFNSSGFNGPIGGAITMTRVYSGFNAFSGWNFDDGNDTPDAPGSSITAKYVTMIGNGCYEEYPVSHDFPAKSCYDDLSNGFGDAWSGQDTDLDSFLCDHCVMAYNTKDAFIGPHTNIKTLVVTNSQSYGNMGAQWKWNNTPNAVTYFANNLTVGNCIRMSVPLPGAPQGYDIKSGKGGAYLSDYCRAAGNTVAINSQQNSSVSFYNNTFVDYIETVFLLGCGPSNNNMNKMCGATTWLFQNNIFLGYHFQGQDAPGLFYLSDPTITVTQKDNVQFANRANHGEVCGTDGNICADPGFINEPQQKDWTDQTFLDNFNFNLAAASPAVHAGSTYSGMLTTDAYGTTRSTSPSAGAVEP